MVWCKITTQRRRVMLCDHVQAAREQEPCEHQLEYCWQHPSYITGFQSQKAADTLSCGFRIAVVMVIYLEMLFVTLWLLGFLMNCLSVYLSTVLTPRVLERVFNITAVFTGLAFTICTDLTPQRLSVTSLSNPPPRFMPAEIDIFRWIGQITVLLWF